MSISVLPKIVATVSKTGHYVLTGVDQFYQPLQQWRKRLYMQMQSTIATNMMTLNDVRTVQVKCLIRETAPLQIVPPMKPSSPPRLATIREERGEGFEEPM
ncbi:hypothetical protein L1987_75705 [Smallanthus sonchifolius]|uniref:Uncharacterized protein n=1 Tax=Smallanthus sonchifolius TaxID=185202 RepID=A0ACB9A5P9_9ASTR|nr:hypothetical protein L1987_75705 [Smallanthus sonchifolius]